MSEFDLDNWMKQMRKGFLEMAILKLLENEDQYGYDIVNQFAKSPLWGISEGTIYPLLSRLRIQDLVKTYLKESSSGPARKYYSLTKKGKNASAQMQKYSIELNDFIK